MLRAVLIMASLAVTTPCFAQEVRVITGDIEHVYGPGAELLDSADLPHETSEPGNAGRLKYRSGLRSD